MSFGRAVPRCALIVFGLLCAMAGPVVAQEAAAGAPNAVSPGTYGTANTNYLWIPAPDFQPNRPGFGWAIDMHRYYHATGSDANPFFAAPLQLPNGAYLDGIQVYYYDGDASHNLEFLIESATGDTNPTSHQITQIFSSGTPGFTSDYMPVGITMDNVNNEYVVAINVNISPDLQFKGARVAYHLQVSPAPAVASFADVPTSSPIFRFVEALKASGITAGCDATHFCPNGALTRGQMAVFLATALGLQWQ